MQLTAPNETVLQCFTKHAQLQRADKYTVFDTPLAKGLIKHFWRQHAKTADLEAALAVAKQTIEVGCLRALAIRPLAEIQLRRLRDEFIVPNLSDCGSHRYDTKVATSFRRF